MGVSEQANPGPAPLSHCGNAAPRAATTAAGQERPIEQRRAHGGLS